MTLSLPDLNIESFSDAQRNFDKLVPTPKHFQSHSATPAFALRKSHRSDRLRSTAFNTVYDRYASQAA
jgi:hypothetical protein